jgi:mRNA-degrading endonuclease YafQ of YafQ-DinJ toxin-antitoxin module
MAIDYEFPALEYIHIGPPTKHDSHLRLPLTFEAPHLRRFWTSHLASPIGSALLSTAIDLVELSLDWIHPSAYPHPSDFLQQLSLLPRLERLIIRFRSPVPHRDIERQLLHTPVTTHFTLPNLRIFYFQGVSAFLEAILPHMDTPLLETFAAEFFNQLRFSIPHLPTFMMTKEKLRFGRATFVFHHEAVFLLGFTGVAGQWSNINIAVMCRHLDWQVSSVAQISNVLQPLFSDVVDLTLDYREHTLSSEWHNEVDCARWRELLYSFRNVKMLRVHNGLVGEVSRALRMDVGPPLEVLPELTEIICPVGRVDDKTFAPFIHEREVAGRPVSLIEKTFPVGRTHYIFYSSNGNIDIGPY